MNLTKKNIQKTSGIHRLGKFYKPGQLVTAESPKPLQIQMEHFLYRV